MKIKKIFRIILGGILLIFLISGIETIREELRDRKLVKLEASRQSCVEVSGKEDALFSSFYQLGTKKKNRYLLSEKVATSIDHILYRGNKNPIRKPVSKSIARAMSVTVFPTSLLCDLTYYSIRGLSEAVLIPFSKGKNHKEKCFSNLDKTKRCALALLSSPTGVISPDLVSQHFVGHPQLDSLIQPYGKLYSARCLELYPKSYEDVASILKQANDLGKKVAFAGALMSQGKQALPVSEDNLLVHFEHLNEISIDVESKKAKVGAGVLWGELQAEVNKHGLAIKVMQASNVFSVGGSLSINCHGWDHQAGTLKDTVISLLVADSQGELLKLYPGDELFDLVIGGLGGFGAILEAEISLTTNTQMSLESIEMPAQDYVSYFKRCVASNPDIGMHYFRLCFDPESMFESGIAVNYINDSNDPIVSSIKGEPDRGNIKEKAQLGVVRRLDWTLPLAWKIERGDALNSIKTNRNEAMTFPLKCIFNESSIDAEWLQEYFVSAENLNGFLCFLGQVLKDNKVPIYNATIRYAKQNKSEGFSYSRDQDMFAVVLFFNQSLLPKEIQKTRTWVQSVINYLHQHKGTFYLPYQHFATLDQFRKCYPEWERVAEKKKEYDPKMQFVSGFFQEYFFDEEEKLLNKPLDSNFRAVFSDPTQRERVKYFLENVFMQLDTQKFIALVDDILKSPHVNDRDVYLTIHKRLKEGSFSFFKKNIQALKSLSSIKRDLSDQVKKLVGDRPIHGYVEIGYPGRICRSIKKKLNLKGPIYVVNEQEQLADYIESGFPRPYNRFVYLNDYESIKYQDIPTGSVDLVAMYIGLHHIPPQKLAPFLQSIHRILSPGGSFILMDHDATSSDDQQLLSVIHSIFNVATSVPISQETEEFRSFQSLEYWEEVLKENGFSRDFDQAPLVRKGDSTDNSLFRFTKTSTTEEEFQAKIHSDPDYKRDAIRTYLTAPEWHNVRLNQGYCNFINNMPFYQFPWFKEIKNMWSVFGKSWKVARREASLTKVLFSDCTLMNLFITSFTSIEFGVKGLISLPLKWIYTSDSVEDARNISMLVKTDIEDLSKVDSRISVKSEFKEGHLKHLVLPRYVEAYEILLKLAYKDITFIDIAGQKAIQVDLCIDKKAVLQLPEGCQKLYETPVTADHNRIHVALDVEVQHLNSALRSFLDNEISVVYIHDF